MNTLKLGTTLSPLALLAVLAACGDDAANGADHADHGQGHDDHPHDFTFVVWPESGSKVFETFEVYVGDPVNVADHIHGTIALILDANPPKVGDPLPEGVQTLPEGKVFGTVRLPVGKHTVHVHGFDEDGKATAEGQTVTWEVVSTPEQLGLRWLEPEDGATVSRKFHVRLQVDGMGMSPAGQDSSNKTVGHHHILIDLAPQVPGLMIPMDDPKRLHYGAAQTEMDVELEPGEYQLTAQFADGLHRSYGERMAATIRVIVE